MLRSSRRTRTSWGLRRTRSVPAAPSNWWANANSRSTAWSSRPHAVVRVDQQVRHLLMLADAVHANPHPMTRQVYLRRCHHLRFWGGCVVGRAGQGCTGCVCVLGVASWGYQHEPGQRVLDRDESVRRGGGVEPGSDQSPDLCSSLWVRVCGGDQGERRRIGNPVLDAEDEVNENLAAGRVGPRLVAGVVQDGQADPWLQESIPIRRGGQGQVPPARCLGWLGQMGQ